MPFLCRHLATWAPPNLGQAKGGVPGQRRLFVKEKLSQPPWTLEETKHLICFLMLHTDGKSWVVRKDYHFWEEAGVFIQQRVHSPQRCTGITICV